MYPKIPHKKLKKNRFKNFQAVILKANITTEVLLQEYNTAKPLWYEGTDRTQSSKHYLIIGLRKSRYSVSVECFITYCFQPYEEFNGGDYKFIDA